MLGGYRLAFAATAVISGAAAILASLTLRDADAASTMHAKK